MLIKVPEILQLSPSQNFKNRVDFELQRTGNSIDYMTLLSKFKILFDNEPLTSFDWLENVDEVVSVNNMYNRHNLIFYIIHKCLETSWSYKVLSIKYKNMYKYDSPIEPPIIHLDYFN